SARSQVGADHLHDPDREGDLEMVEILVDTVGDRTVGEQGGKTFTAGLPERRVSTDVQVGFLLAGKRSRGEIFCGSRAPDRNIGIGAILFAEPVVGRADLVPDAVRDTGAKNQVPYFFPPVCKIGNTGLIETGQSLSDLVKDTPGSHYLPVCVGGYCKPVGDLHTCLRQILVHLAKRGVLAPDTGDIFVPDLIKPAYIFCRAHTMLSG